MRRRLTIILPAAVAALLATLVPLRAAGSSGPDAPDARAAPADSANAGVPGGEAVAAALRELTEQGFPAAVGYLRDGDGGGEALFASGEADTATGEPASVDDRFRIASNTKAFTATVLLQLVGEDRLSLDDTVARWLPGVLTGHGYRPDQITVRQLLNHTSGVHDPATTREFFAPYLEEGDRGT